MSLASISILDSSAPLKEVKKVQIGILSSDEIKRVSVTPGGITSTSRRGKHDGKAEHGGLMDPRQGPVDRSSKCATCGGDFNTCPGHFGHIELAKPIFHVGYMSRIVKVLRCFCIYCSKLLVDPESDSVKNIVKKCSNESGRRLMYIYELCKSKRMCRTDENNVASGCGRMQPKMKRKGLEIEISSNTSDNRLSAERVREIFKAIKNEECDIIGMNTKYSRPEWLILTVLPVPPLCVRPSVKMFNTMEAHDDLTHKLSDIVKANTLVQHHLRTGSPNQRVKESIQLLQYHCATLFDNNIAGLPKSLQTSGRAIKSISDRLKGKEGRIRGNLMGKRVDFSARTVITADPNLEINQVGVPQSIAKNLTFPEVVTPFNIDRMQKLVRNGPDTYPGARYVIKDNGDRIDLRFLASEKRCDMVLLNGHIVERQLVDDDLVVFNRQPSLHKMSMMGHRVKVLPWSTFRLNLSVTTPYNADFDGDEMNLHVPQSLEACAEVSELMMVQRQILTPQANKPSMGIVQDTLTAATKLTRRDTFLTKEDFMNLLMFLPTWNGRIPQPAILKPVPLWTGKQLFSLIIPGKVNCLRTHSIHDDEEDTGPFKWISSCDTKVIIDDGELLAGILCKKTLGSTAGSLMHIVFLELGHEIAGKFYGNIQTVINNWFVSEGHTVGIDDVITDVSTYELIRGHMRQANEDFVQLTHETHRGQLNPLPGNTVAQTFEIKVNKILNDARESVGAAVQNSLSNYNNLKTMVVSGAKGSKINISQIIGCVGQQNVENKRIAFGFPHRTLPHFVKDDISPEAKGFIHNSFLSGLTPTEFFFHAMAGREGVIDTAIKTASTGYIQRCLVKAMESVMVKYDGTVRNSMNNIIQLKYGEDGLAAELLEFQDIPIYSVNDRTLRKLWKFDLSEKSRLGMFLSDEIVEDLCFDLSPADAFDEEWKQVVADRHTLRQIFPFNEAKVVLPCNMGRLITNAQKQFQIDVRGQSDLHPVRVINNVKELAAKLSGETNLLMSIMLRSYLNSKRVTEEYRLNSEAFDWLVGEIETRYQAAQVHPGEMVGALAAQSIAEPATQMTLNTFHHAGVANKNVTLGVPRLKEIINVRKEPQTPSMTVFLESQHVARDLEKCKNVLTKIEHTKFCNVVKNSSIYYDPDVRNTCISEDQEWLDRYFEISLDDVNPASLSAWLLRIELDRRRMTGANLTMSDIVEKILATYGDDELNCMFSDDNDEKLVLRLRLKIGVEQMKMDSDDAGEDANKISDDTFLRLIEQSLLSELSLKGIQAIKKVYLSKPDKNEKKRVDVNERGEMLLKNDEWILETDGTAFAEVLAVPDVDARRTYTNDIFETYLTLGIEAARKCIERELMQVLAMEATYVNQRHLSLLCDVMTSRGHLMPITRHGINKQNDGFLMKCSFEETVDVLLGAAFHSEVDWLKGPSETIMLGKLPSLGTGCFELLLDEKKCEDGMSMVNSEFNRMMPFIADEPMKTPWNNGDASPKWSPTMTPGVGYTPARASAFSPTYNPSDSPYSSFSAQYSPKSPGYTPLSPASPRAGPSSPHSPLYPPSSPLYSPSSPNYSQNATSPSYSPSSPGYSFSQTPLSPKYSPSSPIYSQVATSPSYSPSSPSYSFATQSQTYSPTSPAYSPSQQQTQASPSYTPSSPDYSPTAPQYTPSYVYKPTKPKYSD